MSQIATLPKWIHNMKHDMGVSLTLNTPVQNFSGMLNIGQENVEWRKAKKNLGSSFNPRLVDPSWM